LSDVIINFVGSTEELQPLMDVLDQLAAKEGAIGEKWKQVAASMNAGNTSATQSTGKLSQSIEQVEQSEKAVATQAKVTGAALDTQNKTGTEGSNKLAKSIESLATASKSLDKVVIGGAYKNYLQQIQQQLGLTNKEVVAYIQNARKAAQEAIFSAKDEQEAKELSLTIEVMNEQLKAFGVSEDSVSSKTLTLRTRLQEAKNELAAVIESGVGGDKLEAAKSKVAQLADEFSDLQTEVKTLGSDTKNIDGLINLATGLAGAYSVAQGAAALLGDEDEDLQKSLLKVQAAMSILQGLQQIGNVLQKESAASILLESLFRKQNTQAIAAEAVATEADTVAKEAEITATKGAEVAQKGLNLAFLTSPIGIFVLAVTELVGLYTIFSSKSEEALNNQRKLNSELEVAIDLNERYVDAIGKAGEALVASLKNQGATTAQIRAQETRTIQEQLQQATSLEASKRAQYEQTAEVLRAISEGRIDLDKDEIQELRKTVTEYEKVQEKVFDLQHQLQAKTVDNSTEDKKQQFKDFQDFENAKVAATVTGTDKQKQVQINAINEIAKARESDVDFLSKTESEKALIRANDERQIQDLQLQNYQHYLKGRTSLDEGYVAAAKLRLLQNETDTIASINRVTDLEIEAAKKRKAEALANPTLNEGERVKIVEEANLQIAELEKQKEQKILDNEKSAINARLVLAAKGSRDEYDAKIDFLNKEQQIELSAAELTSEKRAEIDAKFQKQRIDALRAFNEAQLQNIISYDSASLDQFGLTEQQKLPIVIKRLDEQRQLETSQAEGNAAKIAEIDAKYDKQIRDARLASINIILTANLRAIDALFAASVQLNNHILNDNKTNADQKLQANAVLNKIEQDKLDIQLNALKKQKADGLITEEEYTIAYEEILNKRNALLQAKTDKDTDIVRAGIQKQIDLVKLSFDVLKNGLDQMDTGAAKTGLTSVLDLFTQIKDIQNSDISESDKKNAEITAGIVATQGTINQVFADASAERQQQLTDDLQHLEDQKNTELDNANLTAKQKSEIEARYAAKEKALKIKAFNDDKEAKKEQAIINGFLAVTNALATVHPFIPAALIAAGIAAATTAVQVAAIGKTKPPRYRDGEVDIDISKWHPQFDYTNTIAVKGPGTTTSDSIPAWISQGETVTSAEKTAKYKKVLTTIHNNTFENHYEKKISINDQWKKTLSSINGDTTEGLLSRNYSSHQFIYPHVSKDIHIHTHTAKEKEIDYEKLAEAIAKKLPEPTYIENNMDENGLHRFIKKGNDKTEYKNKRYRMK
jgi:hypothetical protein